MNYKVLYRKYRPNNFDSLIGQKHVVEILKNSIKENKVAHAYLFSGPRGTGKTSTARILAKTINCLNNKNGVACEECENCKSFGTNPDIIEIDAASNNGVEEIRELINNVKIMPTSLKYKIYIIDEVHMLSQSAFNALLLTLEEPPEHVIFILATTNLESVPITILSRCQRFDFRKINEKDIIDRLEYICKEENISYELDGLKEIAILADGGLRDALSILDQLSKNDTKITVELVTNEIGSISNQKIKDIIKYLNINDIEKLEVIFNDLSNSSLNYKVVVKKLIYELSEVGSDILRGKDDWNISYDTCKKLVIELNDILNKININVNPYLLIKMIVLNYVESEYKIKKVDTFENSINFNKNEKNELMKQPLNKPKDNSEKKLEIDKIDKFIETRVNNCFVEATKEALVYIKLKWIEFIKSVDDAVIKGLISDTEVVAASNKYAVVESLLPHRENEINEKIKEIEKKFMEYGSDDIKLIFINSDRWQDEKNKYIKNLRNGYKYTYIEEKEQKETMDISDLADVFDIDKIEIE